MSTNRSIVNLSITWWRKVIKIDLPDFHDSMIVATHLTTDSQALVTDDDKIGKLNGVDVIW